MLNDEKAFLANPPANFDGLFHWDWVTRAINRRNIQPCDVDGRIEINHFHLSFETKTAAYQMPTNGQIMALNSEFNIGLYTHIFLWGKKDPFAWQHRTWTHGLSPLMEGPTVAADLVAFCRKWADHADSLSKDAWRDRLREAANTVQPTILVLDGRLIEDASQTTRKGFVGHNSAGHFIHYCACGRWGLIGRDVDYKTDKLGTWYCAEHKPS